MINLISEEVHYISKTNFQDFSDLALISLPDGELFRLNSMTLAAFNSKDPGWNLVKTLSDCQKNCEDELVLITEFNREELNMLVKLLSLTSSQKYCL